MSLLLLHVILFGYCLGTLWPQGTGRVGWASLCPDPCVTVGTLLIGLTPHAPGISFKCREVGLRRTVVCSGCDGGCGFCVGGCIGYSCRVFPLGIPKRLSIGGWMHCFVIGGGIVAS